MTETGKRRAEPQNPRATEDGGQSHRDQRTEDRGRKTENRIIINYYKKL